MKYEVPSFAAAQGVTEVQYLRWLRGRARAHRKRDTKRAKKARITIPPEREYMESIHGAALSSKGVDAYTGELLDWSLIGTWNNASAKREGSGYKRRFRMMPTVDHVHGDDGRPVHAGDLNICGWEVNDAKNDLSLGAFRALCRKVLGAGKP
jgi:hypothetical protein